MKTGHAPFWVGLLMVALAGGLLAQQAPPRPPAQHWIIRVLDDQDRPIAGAEVTSMLDTQTGKTGADGRIVWLAPSSKARITAESFEAETVSLEDKPYGTEAKVWLRWDGSRPRGALPLDVHVAARRSGWEDPISGARVHADTGVRDAVTDANGDARIYHRTAVGEDVTVVVSAQGFLTRSERVFVQRGRQQQQSSGVDSVRIEMTPGVERSAPRGVVILVQDFPDHGIDGATVRLYKRWNQLVVTATTRNGEARIDNLDAKGLPPAEREGVMVEVTAPGYQKALSAIDSDRLQLSQDPVIQHLVYLTRDPAAPQATPPTPPPGGQAPPGGQTPPGQTPPPGGQSTNTSSPSVPRTQTLLAGGNILRDCFEQGVPGEGCLLRIAMEAGLAPGVRATIVAPTPAGASPVNLGQATLGPGMAASAAPAYADGLAAYVAIASRLKQHKIFMGQLGEYQSRRRQLRLLDETVQREERDAEEALRGAMAQVSAIPNRAAEKATESQLCADAADLQTGIDRLRNNAAALLGEMRTALAAASAVTCSTPADAQAIRAGWRQGNDRAADLRRVLAEVTDKTAQRRQILPRLNRDRAAKDAAAERLAVELPDAERKLASARESWVLAGSLAGQAREHYRSVIGKFQDLQMAIGTQPPNAKGPDWVFGLFTDDSVRAPYEAFREAVGREQESPPTEPQARTEAWMTAHGKLGRDIRDQEDKVTALRNDLYKRTCDATDHDTLDAVRRIVGDADVEIETYQGLPAKADVCETPPAPPAAPVPVRLWFEPDTVLAQAGTTVAPKVFAEFSDAPGRAVDVTDRVGWAGGERLPLTVTGRHAGQTLRAEVGLGSLAAALTIQVAAAGGPPGGAPQAAPTARLECDGSVGVPTNVLEIEAGQSLRKTCRVIVTGWVSDTADRVFSEVQGLRPGTLDVFPPSDFAPGAQMYRAGVNDAWREYRFSHSFSAPASPATNSFPLVITVRQEDSQRGGDRWFIALPLLVNVIPSGASPGTSLAPPAVVRQGSGGQYGVWRYKLFGDPPPCFHFVAAVLGKYGPPGYEQVGANMTFGEADAEIGRLSRYFDDQYGCAAWPRDRVPPPPPPAPGRQLVMLRFAPRVMTARVGVPLMPRVLAAYSDAPGTNFDVTAEVRWSGTRTRVPVEAFPSEAGATLKLTATLEDQSDTADINVKEETPAPPTRKISRFGFAEHSLRVKVGASVAPKVYVVYSDEPARATDVTADPRVKFAGDRIVPFTAQAADAGKTFTITATLEWASDSATVTVEAAAPSGPAPSGGRTTWVRQAMSVNAAANTLLTIGESSLSYSYAGNQFGPMSNTLKWSLPPATLQEGQELTLELSVGHFSEWKQTRYGFEGGSITGGWNVRCFASPGDLNGGGTTWGGVIGADSSVADRNSVSKKIVFQPRSATGDRGDECYLQISAGAFCADGCGQYWAVITWPYTRQAPR